MRARLGWRAGVGGLAALAAVRAAKARNRVSEDGSGDDPAHLLQSRSIAQDDALMANAEPQSPPTHIGDPHPTLNGHAAGNGHLTVARQFAAAGSRRTAATALVGVAIGILAPAVVLASPWRPVSFAATLIFVIAGLGPGITCRIDARDVFAQLALTLVVSLTAFALAAAIMIWLASWHPVVFLLLAIPSVCSCSLRLLRLGPAREPSLST